MDFLRRLVAVSADAPAGRSDQTDTQAVQAGLHALAAFRAQGGDPGLGPGEGDDAVPTAPDASQSSGAVGRARKARRRRGGAPRVQTTAPRFDTSALAQLVGPAEAEATPRVVVEDFGALYRDFDQVRAALRVDGTAPTATGGKTSRARSAASGGAAAAAAAAASEPHPRHPVHRENPEARPWLVDEFRFLLSRLPVPRFSLLLDGPVGPAFNDPEFLHAALREGREDRRLLLPVLTASHESLLLAEAGTFPLGRRQVTYPPCRWGAQCVGVTEQLRGWPSPGVVLTALLLPAEYETLLVNGRAPTQSRPCVLCYRFHAMDYVLTLRPNFARVGGVHPGVVQSYRNLVDEPEGYFRECVLLPSTTRFEGFVDPIALFRRSFLQGRRDPQQGNRWVVDQSAMCVPATAAPQPDLQIGMPLERF